MLRRGKLRSLLSNMKSKSFLDLDCVQCGRKYLWFWRWNITISSPLYGSVDVIDLDEKSNKMEL